MNPRTAALIALIVPLCACDGVHGVEPMPSAAAPPPATPSVMATPSTSEPSPSGAPISSPAMVDPAVADPALAGRTLTRTIERDANNDGIPESRVFITETFDAQGRLASRTREVDRDADGIIDSKTVTDFN
jgi:hypothetical protein